MILHKLTMVKINRKLYIHIVFESLPNQDNFESLPNQDKFHGAVMRKTPLWKFDLVTSRHKSLAFQPLHHPSS